MMKTTDEKIAELRDRVLVRMIEEANAQAEEANARADKAVATQGKLQEIIARRTAKIEALQREAEILRAELRGVRLGRDMILALHEADAAPQVDPDPYHDLWVELAGLDDPTFWDPNKWPDHIKPVVAHLIQFDPPVTSGQEEDLIW